MQKDKFVFIFLSFIAAIITVLVVAWVSTAGAAAYSFIAGATGFCLPYLIKYVSSHFNRYNKQFDEIKRDIARIEKDFDTRCDSIVTTVNEAKLLTTQSHKTIISFEKQIQQQLNELKTETYSGIADAQRAIKTVDIALNFTRHAHDGITSNSKNVAKIERKVYLLGYKARLLRQAMIDLANKIKPTQDSNAPALKD